MSGEVKVLDKMPERIPVDGTFELTIRCNLHCKMCLFRHDDSENAEIMANELTAEQWIDMGRQVAEAGTLQLLITGGEPLLRPDFCEIWEGLYKIGFIMTLYTNATLVTDEVMECLRKYPPHKIGVTIYGSNAVVYDIVTGSGVAFHRMIDGIQKLQTLPSNIEYRSTIIQDNYSDINSIEELVLELTKDKKIIVTESRMLFPAVRGGCADVPSCRLTPKENIDLYLRRSKQQLLSDIQASNKKLVGYRISVDKKEQPNPSGKYKASLLGCAAGMSSYAVAHNGYMLPCQPFDLSELDLKSIPFTAAWDALPFKIRLPELCSKCRDCDAIDYCAACPASRFAESGSMGGWADYICADAQELKKHTEFTFID